MKRVTLFMRHLCRMVNHFAPVQAPQPSMAGNCCDNTPASRLTIDEVCISDDLNSIPNNIPVYNPQIISMETIPTTR
ncbi:MAG: hypothetical protein ABIO04_07965, partial [Ferruginibacter sp.]